jgi:hypothetical protein
MVVVLSVIVAFTRIERFIKWLRIIDHDGALNKIQNLLCGTDTRCNTGVGGALDDGKMLTAKKQAYRLFHWKLNQSGGSTLNFLDSHASWNRFKCMFEDMVEKAVARANVELDIDSIGETSEA